MTIRSCKGKAGKRCGSYPRKPVRSSCFLAISLFRSVNTSFNLYRDGKKVAEVPATTGTFYRDTYESKKAATYTIKPVVDGAETGHIEGSYTLPANAPTGYINIPLDPPTDGTTPAGQKYTYIPNDASIGDVDGNGRI